MNKQQSRIQNNGLARIRHAFFYSMDGLKAAWLGEAAFRQELVLVVVLVPVCIWIPATLTQKAMMLGALIFVLIVELLNSALEAVVDRVSLERHELSKRAKDIGSAAVLMALINLFLIWALVIIDIFW